MKTIKKQDDDQTAPASPKRRSRKQMMEVIAEAAVQEFSQHGFAGASTQAIAEKAELTKSSLHYYIADKETLYLDILADVMERWSTLFVFDETASSPEEVITEYLRAKLDFALDEPERSRIFTSELLSGGHRLEKFWARASESTHAKINIIETWIAEGQLRKLDARLLMMNMWSMTQYYADYAIQTKKLLGTTFSKRAERQHLLEEIVEFTLLGCGIVPTAEKTLKKPRARAKTA